MLIKFLARGTGSAAAAATYLLAEWDAAGTRRAAVEVLRGDPHKVAAVADSLPFKHRYTSGVMAWSPEDAPTGAELERVVDEFEETAWTGLERDRYVWAVILHRDHDGGVHLHFFAARCDLATGRSLNIAPPGWQKTFDPLRDALNFEHGWSRPDDPARARPFRPSPSRAYLDAETLRAGWEVEPNPRELIGKHLMARVSVGTVTDRAGVVGALEELGLEVTRQGEHYVTARHPESGDRWRLKGTLYERDFDREQFVQQQAPEPSGDREPADRGDDAARAAEAWQKVEEHRGQRAEYHQARYGRGSREGRARARGAREAAGDVERESEPAAAGGREAGPESLAGHLRGELGHDAVVAAESSAAEREQELEATRGAAAGDATACLAVLARVSVVHDRDRAAADSGLTSVVRAVRAGAEAAGRADRVLAGAGRVLAAAGRTARGCGDALDRAVQDAGPDLTELMCQRQEQRAVAVAGREQAVCATSPGSEWLDEVQQEVLGGADRHPTVAERTRIVETVEDRIGTHLAGLEESLAATSAGPALLREEFGDRDARLSFAEWERGLERVKQRVDEELRTQEEALRLIPLGKQYLSEAEQALAAEAAGPPARAELESMVRAVAQRVGEELDRLEEELVAIAGSENLRAEAAGAGDGRTLSLGEQWEDYERVKSGLEAELDHEEAAVREDPAGEEFLRDARLEVLGSANREAATLSERARIVKAAAEAKRHAEEKWNEEKAARVEMLRALPGGLALYHAHLADRDPKWSLTENTPPSREHDEAALAAAESDGDRQRLRDVLSDEAATACYREVLGQVVGQFKTPDLDRALAAGEREQQRAAAERRREAERRAHVGKREEALRATSLGGRWLDEAHQRALAGADRELAVVVRERIADAIESRFASDLARREASLAATASGLALLREEYGEAGIADPPRSFLRRERVVEQGEWEAKRDARFEALGKKPGGTDLFHAHLADLDPAWDRDRNNTSTNENIDAALTGAESDDARQKRLRGVLSDESDAACYEEVLDQVVGQFKASDLDNAIAAGEKARAERELQQWREKRDARVDALANLPGGLELYHAHLADLDPQWGVNGNTTTTRENIDAALTATESDDRRQKRLRGVLSTAAALTRFCEERDKVAGQFKTSDLDRALAAGEEARTAEQREAEKRRRAHVEKREEALRATSLGGRWLDEAHQEALAGADRQLALVVRERIADTVESRFASDLARREAALAATASGLALLRKEYGEAGIADPPRNFLRRERVIEQGEWEAKRDARLQALGKQPGGTDLFHAHLADLDPAWDRNRNNTSTRENIDAALTAAESDDRRLERLRTVLSDVTAKARYREVLDDNSGQFKTSDLDRALAAAERKREEHRQAEERRRVAAAQQRRREKRLSRLEQVLDVPAAAEAFIAVLDAQNPSWRTGASPADIDQALDAAEGSLGDRKPPSRQYQLVLETERTIPDAPSTACRAAGGRFDRTTEVGREGWRVSQTLSDRALARAFAAEKPEPPAPRNLAERLFDWLRTQLEKLFRPSRRAEPAVAEVSAAEGPPRLTFEERYSQQWPEHADNIHHPDFEKLAAGAEARNKLFERQQLYSSSKWTTVEPKELPIALTKSAPAWTDEAVEKVTWRATPGVGYPERTLRRQIADAHLDDYENQLPERYARSTEWRAIRERAEEAVWKLQHDGWRYKRADRRKDDRKKRELEAAAINRSCGRDARRLHEKMMSDREAARPDWEVTLRIRAVQQLIRNEEEDRRFKLQQEQRARERERERERPVHERPERGPTKDQGRGR